MPEGSLHTERFSFDKAEKLCSKVIIADVFETGQSFLQYPLKVVYKPVSLPTKALAQLMISVPKRNFKKAVMRNLLKRRIREAYRKNKHSLYIYAKAQNFQYALVLIYIGKEPIDSRKLEEKIVLSLQRIVGDEQSVK